MWPLFLAIRSTPSLHRGGRRLPASASPGGGSRREAATLSGSCWAPPAAVGAVSPRPAGLHCGPTNARRGRAGPGPAGALGNSRRMGPGAEAAPPHGGAAQLRVPRGCVRGRACLNSRQVGSQQHVPGAGPRLPVGLPCPPSGKGASPRSPGRSATSGTGFCSYSSAVNICVYVSWAVCATVSIG